MVRSDKKTSIIDKIEKNIRQRDKPKSIHGQQLYQDILAKEARKALEEAEASSLKDINHRYVIMLLRRFAKG